MRERLIPSLVFAAACVVAAALVRPRALAEGDVASESGGAATPPPPSGAAGHASRGELTAAGRAARGIYINSFAMRRTSARTLVREMRRLVSDA